MRIELTPDQRTLLLQLLDTALREIGPEIRHSDSREYRDDLKERRRELQTLHSALAGPAPVIVPPAIADAPMTGLVGTP